MKKTFILTAISLFMAFAGNSQAVEVDLLGNVDVHGFVSQGYMRSQHNNYLANDSSDGTFAFNEIGINFSKQRGCAGHFGIGRVGHLVFLDYPLSFKAE